MDPGLWPPPLPLNSNNWKSANNVCALVMPPPAVWRVSPRITSPFARKIIRIKELASLSYFNRIYRFAQCVKNQTQYGFRNSLAALERSVIWSRSRFRCGKHMECSASARWLPDVNLCICNESSLSILSPRGGSHCHACKHTCERPVACDPATACGR